MTDFTFTSPQGKKYKISGPEGATVEEAFGILQDTDAFKRGERTWLGAAGEALTSVPESAVKTAEEFAQPFLHPIETAENIGNLGAGVLEKTGLKKSTGKEKYAEAAWEFLKERYGGEEEIKNTLATDPVGLISDLTIVLGPAGALKAPAAVAKTGLKAAGRAVKAAGEETLGATTLVGPQSIARGVEAGFAGGERAAAFQENMRGTAEIADVVSEAQDAVKAMRKARGKEYTEAMKSVAADRKVLDFDKVDAALADITDVKAFHGEPIAEAAQETRLAVGKAVKRWKELDPNVFHTAEGLDALKQKIGDIRDGTQYGTPDRVIADRAYQAVRQTIIDQVPQYARIMAGYEQASDIIRGVERELSLKPNASVDTALRKLQSVLRNNVHTGYGRRAELADYLINAGAPHLLEKLAGQALNQWAPRGLGRITLTPEIMFLALKAPWLLPSVIVRSPRATGEAAYYLGKGARKASDVYGAARNKGLPPASVTIPTAVGAGRLDEDVESALENAAP